MGARAAPGLRLRGSPAPRLTPAATAEEAPLADTPTVAAAVAEATPEINAESAITTDEAAAADEADDLADIAETAEAAEPTAEAAEPTRAPEAAEPTAEAAEPTAEAAVSRRRADRRGTPSRPRETGETTAE